tara:strand:+ start:284 stop:1045 length:762 start_codon:yes stop_codon:yes gene_type:complete
MKEDEMSIIQKKYPNLYKCVPSTANMISILRSYAEDAGQYELEARFGKMCGNKFIPGVDRVFMDTIIEWMQKSQFILGDDGWKEELDMYYDYMGKSLRTRVQYDHNNMMVNSCTTEKKMLMPSLTFYEFLGDKRGTNDIRVSLKTEYEICNPPVSINPTLVRVKQRRRFVTENNMWAFDFSMTWSGNSKSEAERLQMTEDATYEIECELIDSYAYLQGCTDNHAALSILLKMYDLLPSDSKFDCNLDDFLCNI